MFGGAVEKRSALARAGSFGSSGRGALCVRRSCCAAEIEENEREKEGETWGKRCFTLVLTRRERERGREGERNS